MVTIRALIFASYILFSATACMGQTQLRKQALQFVAALRYNNNYPMGGIDTLIDLNRDGYKDILIEYYGMCGTGLKNRVDIYPYDTFKKRFTLKNKIGLTNPTFYFATNTIASYYIAYGGGGAAMHCWKGNKIVMYEEIDVEVEPVGNDNVIFKHTLTRLRNGTTRKWTDSMVNLPDKYKYWDYTPLIKRRPD